VTRPPSFCANRASGFGVDSVVTAIFGTIDHGLIERMNVHWHENCDLVMGRIVPRGQRATRPNGGSAV
jgi:hypothetical protein